ncbi:structural maintenance of chromosomes protein 6 [Mayamaea pseudoterrestris]|nr:structural maintenance of chromosomes protein 6 [Mayamaea pseudoterrestris]
MPKRPSLETEDDGDASSSPRASKRRVSPESDGEEFELQDGLEEQEENDDEQEVMGDEEQGASSTPRNNDDDEYNPATESPAKQSGAEEEYNQDEQEDAIAQELGDEAQDMDDDHPRSKARRDSPLVHRPKNKPRVNVPAEAGIIKNIYLENFMCHRKLSIDFCPNANFVNGANGSGKSAILAAIQICLGATAKRTGRGRNMRELIRDYNSTNAPAYAKVRVSLANGGSDGYKQDVYGNVITVERTISNGAGFSGYKLLDANGKEKSRDRHELYEMLDHLNIQVENPVSVLSQEEAKTFIHGNEKEKYKFFMKATELERISCKHAETSDEISNLTVQCDKMKKILLDDNSRVIALKKKWEQHRAVDKLELKVQELVVKMAWAKYWDVEKQYQGAKADKERMDEKAKKKMAELTQAEELASQPDTEHDRLTERIQELVREGQAATKAKRDLEDELREAEAPKKQLLRQLDRLKRARLDNGKKLSAAQKRLESKRKEILDNANNSDEAKITALLQEKEAELANAKAQSDQLNESLNTSRREYEEAEPQVEQARAMVSNREEDLRRVSQRLEGLNRADGDEFAALGRNVKKVFSQVVQLQKQGKFQGHVVGPVAKYLKVAAGKEAYAKLAERALGFKALDKFIVTNDHDRVLLQKIRVNCGCSQDCEIIQTYSNARFNVPASPAAGIETVATVLSISDDLVFNTLVDMYSIDQKALALDKKASEEGLLITQANGQQSIKGNINEVYFAPRGDIWTIRGGFLSLMSNERPLTLTIGTDKSAAIASTKVEMTTINEELKKIRHDLSRLDAHHTELQRVWNTHRKQQQANAKAIGNLTSKIAELKDDLDCLDNAAIDTRIEEEEVAEAESEIEQIRADEEKTQAELEDLTPHLEEISSRLAELNQRNDHILKDMGETQNRLTNLLETQTQQQGMVDRYKLKLAQYEEMLAKHQDAIDKWNEELLKALYKARIVHHQYAKMVEGNAEAMFTLSQAPPDDEVLEEIEPVPVGDKGVEYYRNKVKRAQEKVDQERKKQRINDENPEEAHQKYIQAKENLVEKTNKIKAMDEHISCLTKDILKRKHLWREFLFHLKTVTKAHFHSMLSMNNYSGTLEFDDGEQKLDLIVEKRENTGASQRDMKGLSGGERSYTTICLLNALGENLETPFRILDEFDVYLDPQNRQLVLGVLIHTAKVLLHRQFIFITPQDLSSIKVDNLVRIFKLDAPERRDKAGGPVQQTLD